MATTILVVDDHASVRTLMREYLNEQGYRVDGRERSPGAGCPARNENPDLILLDIMMPEMDGYQFINAYRKEANTPIILLTAKQDETDKVIGLELGADDYITKPFGMRELLARIRAVLRRVGKRWNCGGDSARCRTSLLDRAERTVTVGDRSVSLTPTEFELLATLMSAPGRVFSRAALLESVQGVTFESMERTVNVHIRNLRTRIEPDPSNPRYIETVFGVGYRFAND